MEVRKQKTRSTVAGIDKALFVLVLVFAAVGAVLLRLSPKWWEGYLTIMDVRYWPPWKAVGLGIVLMQSLMVVRLWPKQK